MWAPLGGSFSYFVSKVPNWRDTGYFCVGFRADIFLELGVFSVGFS